MPSRERLVLQFCVAWLVRLGAAASIHATVARSSAEDWPHWRGPARNGVTSESSGWKDDRWRIEPAWEYQAGEGGSSPIAAAGRVYVLGWQNEHEQLSCLDERDGRPVWTVRYPAPRFGREATGDQGIYSGASATPELDAESELIFTLGIDGDLQARRTDSGELVWGWNLYERYHVGQRPDVGGKRGGESRRDYGYTAAPLVSGDTLIVEVGDVQSGTVKGFDKRTGKEIWSSACRDEAGHSGGLVPLTSGQIPLVAILTLRNLVLIRLDAGHEGETFAQEPWTTDFGNNIPTPAVEGDRLIVTTSYNQSAMACFQVAGPGRLRELWRTDNPSGVCSPVVFKDHVFWAWRGIHAASLAAGAEAWMVPRVGTPGSCLVTGDQRLIVLGDNGDLSLLDAGSQLRELARKPRLFSTECWPHLVLANQRLYCKDRLGHLRCFAVGL
jgi:outer membrane protein assembly factor BamB